MHMDMSQESFHARIFRKNAGGQRAYPDLYNPALTLTVRTLSVDTLFWEQKTLVLLSEFIPMWGSQSRVSPGLASTGGLSQGHHAVCDLGRLLRGKQDGSHFWAFVGHEITHSVTGGLGWGVKRPKNNSIFGCFSKKLHKRLLSLQVQQTPSIWQKHSPAFFAILYVSPKSS